MPCFLSHLLYNFICVWEFAMGSVFFSYFSMCLSLEILKFVYCSLNLSLRLSNTLSCCCLPAHCFSSVDFEGVASCFECSVLYWRSPWPSWFWLFNLILLYFFSGKIEDLLLPTLFCNFLIMGFYVGWLLYWDWFLQTILIWILVFSVLWCVFILLTLDFLCFFYSFFRS